MRSRALLLLCLPLTACAVGDDGPTPLDGDAPVSAYDPLFMGAPNNADLPEEGKADAVYPHQYTDLLATQSPVKSQGSRGVCSIFATVALMEHLYLAAGAPVPDFSEQYLQWSVKNQVGDFANTEGSNASSNLEAIHQYGIVAEQDWPYERYPWNASNDPACTGGEDNLPTKCFTNGEPPQRAQDARKWTLPAGRWINSKRQSIKAHLFTTHTGVVVGLTFFYQSWNHRLSTLPVSSDNWRKGIVLAPNAKDQEVSLAKRAGHAIEIVGWDDDYEVPVVDEHGATVKDAQGNVVTEKGFWIFKNSWGTGSFGVDNPNGDGYGYLSMKYVEDWGTAYVSGLPTLDTPPPATGTTHTYSASPAAAIPDNDPAGIASTISVPDAGTLRSLEVTVAITHTYRGDLVVRLVHGAQTIVLADHAGGADDNLNQTFAVSDVVGASLTGDWRLEVADTAAEDTGTLDTWSLKAVTQ
jgi:hypothetical protein